MLISHIVRPEHIATNKIAANPGTAFRVDGNPFEVHVIATDVTFGIAIYVSEDGVNWILGTDADGVALTGLANGDYRIARERPMWIRATAAADPGSRIHTWVLGVRKYI